MENKLQIATFAGGCFWCTEAVFLRLNGVEKVVSGYTGGIIKNPRTEKFVLVEQDMRKVYRFFLMNQRLLLMNCWKCFLQHTIQRL